MNQVKQTIEGLIASGEHITLKGIRRGIEKEALRISLDGNLAQTPHPKGLGAALTHPHITTDFSEALLEFITPPCDSIEGALKCLEEIQQFSCRVLEKQDEKLWMASMPCMLSGDENIPLADYGTSNTAKMKKVYREGLGNRYGRSMQTIAGIHYNFSLPDDFWQALQGLENGIESSNESLQDFKTKKYFALIRNYRRYFWLLLYLFGAAPAVCKTFVKERKHELEEYGEHSLHHQYATSLRMGDLGYQSQAQSDLVVDYNSLDSYISSLLKGLTTSHPAYEAIGLKTNGEYKQLNTNVLQIENEFYATIRPKRITESGEIPIHALGERGVEYVEVRSVDINPFDPLGIDVEQAQFIEVFLLFCLLKESPASSKEEYHHIHENQHRVVNNGRDPEQTVFCGGQERNLRKCGENLLNEISEVSNLFAEVFGAEEFSNLMKNQQAKIKDASLTPSGKIMKAMEEKEQSFFRFAINQSFDHCESLSAKTLAPERLKYFEEAVGNSLEKQEKIDEADEQSFDDFLVEYFSQYQDYSARM